jgi:hypothetical protein
MIVEQMLKNAETQALNTPVVSHRLFFVVAQSHTEEGNWEQISNGFDDYSKAKLYRDGSFCKGRWPNAFIVASLNEG